MFDESFLQDVADRNDIVDVVGSYVRLGKKSGSNLFGLCPFHNEKTPSFSVSPDKQIYHCFGCGKGGGVFNFIMEMEGLTYPEAVEFLAKRAGMQIPERESTLESRKRSRLYALNKDAARFFHDRLLSPAGAPGMEYMRKRKISAPVATRFGLGYAPDTWDSLCKAMHFLGYTNEELVAADLVRPGRNGGYYDTFRNRLMFPVIDIRGNVIGFSGRILGDGEPKYLNSKETLVFNKGKNLFGLNLAKKSKSGYLILVEGNIDVVSLHQAGFDSAIASLGTSLTNEQARLISRFTGELIIAYDNDGAGMKASQRAISILEHLDVKVRILRMNGAKDPDEFIKANGIDAFQALISRSEAQADYRLNNIQKKYDFSSSSQKVEFLQEAAEMIAALSNKVEREVYAMRISELVGIKPDVVISEVDSRRARLLRQAKKSDDKSQSRPLQSFQPKERSFHYSDPPSAAAEEGVIRLIFLDPSLLSVCDLKEEEFTSPELAQIFQVLKSRIENHESAGINALSSALSAEETSLLVSFIQSPEILSNGALAMHDYISRIRDRRRQASLTDGSDPSPDLRNMADILKTKGKGYKK